jgi:nifR3 family TIM-barrel protein
LFLFVTHFWNTLPVGFFVLAPMEDVTDTVFRQVIMQSGRPDVLFTEFTNCEGAQSVGQAKVIHRLKYSENERPIVAQIWGVTPEDYFKTARMILELGFDGVDINMGCPVKSVIRQGACSALIKNHSLALEIVQAVKEGVNGEIPVSIKTRIGFHAIDTENWFRFIFSQCKPDALTVHGRTAKEESKVPCHWDEIGNVVIMNNEINQNINKPKIIGNGDILSYQQGLDMIQKYSLDGIMIGRAVFQNPWIFDPSIDPLEKTVSERIEILLYHLGLWQNTWGDTKQFNILKKYFKIYISGFDGAAHLRSLLMEATTATEVHSIISDFQLTKVVT